MKKILSLICIAANTLTFLASAQDIFILEKMNGEKLEFNVSNIKQMYFKEAEEGTGNLAPDGIEMVDLGLSVAWASANVGATKPEETGIYVQWGDTIPKNWYSWSYYTFGSAQNIGKYTVNDGLITLQTENDLASKKWGTDWRTPTMDEVKELIDNCDIEYNATENGVLGVRFTSKVDGYADKSIFLPATGYKQDNLTLNPEDVYVWTSTVAQGFYQFAISLFACNGGDYAERNFVTGNYRYIGMNIRPVAKVPEKTIVEDIVDMGLSVDWGTMNFGANAPEEVGTYVAWGETEAKDSYTWNTYVHGSSSVSQSKYSKADKLEVLDDTDDVIKAAKGGNWRMPTDAEFSELLANCEYNLVQVNNVNCMEFTSKVVGYEGAKIVIPLGGYYENSSITNDKSVFALWSANVVASGFRSSAYGLEGTAMGTPTVKSANRYIGRNVRGVRTK